MQTAAREDEGVETGKPAENGEDQESLEDLVPGAPEPEPETPVDEPDPEVNNTPEDVPDGDGDEEPGADDPVEIEV